MKILFVATPECGGHHFPYFEALLGCVDEAILVTEKISNRVKCRQYCEEGLNFGTKSFKEYLKVIAFIRRISKQEKPDLVHIQCGDNFYRFFGAGLNSLACKRVVMTFHHMRRGKLRDISFKKIFGNISAGVVHTESQKKMLESMGIKNVVHIEYPQFNKVSAVASDKAKEFFGLKKNRICLAAIGSTRDDKGVDILLCALQKVKTPFQLLIAGAEGSINKEKIVELISTYKECTIPYIKYLSEEELVMALNAADIITLPYRKCFDGASGPLVEGVALGKMIIGPNHGSLGNIIEGNHLGYVFESENVTDLTKTIENALASNWKPDDKYVAYKDALKPERFREAYTLLFERVYRHG